MGRSQTNHLSSASSSSTIVRVIKVVKKMRHPTSFIICFEYSGSSLETIRWSLYQITIVLENCSLTGLRPSYIHCSLWVLTLASFTAASAPEATFCIHGLIDGLLYCLLTLVDQGTWYLSTTISVKRHTYCQLIISIHQHYLQTILGSSLYLSTLHDTRL